MQVWKARSFTSISHKGTFSKQFFTPGIFGFCTPLRTARTAVLGGHVDACNRGGHRVISYNSCRNRHCPKCQGAARERWLADRTAELLPVPYFHVVFTLPQLLAPLALQNQSVVYGI